MRLSRYINEAVGPYEIKSILDNCKPFITAIRGIDSLLYRGGRYRPSDAIIEKVRRHDRHPHDTPRDVQEMFDKAFLKKFGWKCRSEGVFATGSLLQASGYGPDQYIFFPIGKFRFVWAKEIEDLYIIIDDYDDIDNEVASDIVEEDYTDKNLSAAVKSKSEIMFDCDRYYMVKRSYEQELLYLIRGDRPDKRQLELGL